MVKKKSENGTTTRRKTVYELVGERVPRSRREVDPLDDILFEEERELAREHKRLRLEQIVEKRRREVEKMREGIVDGGTLPSNTDFLNMAKFMAELSPEEAQRVRSSYTFLKLADKGGVGGMSYLPMLLNYAKANPGASENQMIDYLKLMDSQLMKGLEIAKAMNPPKQGEPMTYMVKGMELMKAANPGKQDNPMEFLKLMKDLVISGVRDPLIQAMKENQPQPGLMEQIFMKPELFSRFKEIGLFGGKQGGAGTTEMDLKIAQITTANTLELKKLDLEWRKDALERDAKDRRTDTIMTAFAPFAAVLAGPVSQKMQQLGQQQATAHNPTGRMQPSETNPTGPPKSTENQVLIKCTCGHQGVETFQGAIPASFNCPECGQILLVGDPSIAGKLEETDTGTRI